ncbi:hypothetical protein FZEAL_903 [Fusarium zealandicum]|uniref:Uncharacterized protein n=1 Tax=Fusarium zealandicum TaxID=1053134 RepID=A0A8H4UTU6_9HYPO|nr:hypothetical protein FZEAL_903 [Fusarium zealandicum]
MNISDSDLFKDYARPVLNPDPRPGGVRCPPFGIMDTVMQHLLGLAKLQVSRIKISNATQDSFCLTIESRLSGTGPVSSTINATNVNLFFNGSSLGRMELPQIRAGFWGTKVLVKEQRIDIADIVNYRAFIRSLMVHEDTSLQLDDSQCTVKALGTSSICEMRLDMPIKGMGGPRISLEKLSRSGDNGIVATFSINNTSPVEIDHDRCLFELRNTQGDTMAELRGELNIVQGQANYTLHGTTRDGVAPSDKARLVGVGVEGSSWCGETIKELDAVFVLRPEFAELLRR